MTASSLDPAQKTTHQRTVLLATDRNQSVLTEITDGKHTAIAYSSYGKQSAQEPIATALGFNGQLRESSIDWYLLGNGYRAFNPVLMRFHSPDSWSPFGRGGLNAYMYCAGDPVNRVDPTGHIWDVFTLVVREKFIYRNPQKLAIANTKAIARQEAWASVSRSSHLVEQSNPSRQSDAVSLIGGYIMGAPGARNPVPSPGGDLAPQNVGARHPRTHAPVVPWIVSPTAQAPSSSTGQAPASAGLRTSIGADLPPSYNQATQSPMKLSTVDTLTKSMATQKFQIYLTDIPRPTYGFPPAIPPPRPQPQFNNRQAAHAPIGPLDVRTMINRGAATPAQTQRNLRRLGRL